MKKAITLFMTVVFSICNFCFDSVLVSAQSKKPIMGMLTLEARGGLSEAEAAIISDRLQEHLVKTDVFEIVERGKVNEILKEQGFQQTGMCNEAECAVRAGEIIGAEQMVAGSIGKVGKTFALSVRVFDVGTSRIIKAVSKDYEGPIEKLLTRVVPEVARELAGLPPLKPRGKKRTWALAGGVLAIGGGVAAMMLSGKKKETPSSTETQIPLPPSHPE